ncbi:MAG: hypothetical protein WBG50_05385 [Desulfomonilaceae bacterium]
MKRVVVLCVGILALAIIPAAVSAQGLLPNFPLLGGVFGNSAACGETPSLGLGPLVGYVGWMPYVTNGVALGVGGGPLGPIYEMDQLYSLSGVWFGLEQTCHCSDWLGFMATGWYLVPSNSTSTEVYDNGVLGARPWNPTNEWWFVDGAFLINGPGCVSLILGLRYDYFNTEFSNTGTFFTSPAGVAAPFTLGLPTDQATAESQGWIPLIGTQVAYTSPTTNLTVRAVGFPTLLGNVKYRETIGALGSAEFTGTYNNGYFLEVFTDYTRKFGAGGVGVFARWNMTHGNCNSDLNLPVVAGNNSFALGVNRTSWTFGGSFSLSFNSPF